MTDKVKIFAFFVAMATLFIFVAGLLGGIIGYNKGKASCVVDADTVVVESIDTVTLVETRYDTLIRIVEKLRPVAVHDTVTIGDTMYMVLPYESRHYSIPDTLDVWYSGVDPSVDSARVYVRSKTETITIVQEVARTPRLAADFGAGALYCENSVNPYLFGELRYSRPKTTFTTYGAIDQNGRWGAGLNVTYRINIIK